jgi:hypothetical protein
VNSVILIVLGKNVQMSKEHGRFFQALVKGLQKAEETEVCSRLVTTVQ